MPINTQMGVFVYLLNVAFMFSLTLAETTFPMALYNSLYVPKSADSVFISPINLKATLAVAALAAKGKTEIEFLETMNSTVRSLDKDILLPGKIVEAVEDKQIYVGDILIDAKYKDKVSSVYEFQNVTFGPNDATKKINQRVKDVTKRWIGEIFPKSLSKNTAMVAVNSLYIHAHWKHEFTSTIARGFKKPMVHQYGDFLYANLSDLNTAALVMELKDNDVKLLVLQPNDHDLERLGSQLLDQDLTVIPKHLKKTYMSLFFPIIKEIKTSISLKDALANIAIDRAFSDKCNFGKLVDACDEGTGVKLKEVRQHTNFKTDRTGARFVSVTGLQFDLIGNTRSSCTCLPDEYLTEFADPNELESLLLALRKKGAPHYYFEHELFFALIKKKDVLFIGTLTKKK